MIYQVTFIVSNDADKDAVKKVVQAVGGNVVHERTVGQRTFTYPIKGLKEGIYFTYHIDIDPAAVSALDEKLRLEDAIVRFLIVKTEKVIIPSTPVVREQKEILPAVPEKVEKAIEPVIKKETKPVVAKPEPKKPVKEPKKPAKVSALEEAKRLKTLEEKLQELLKE